LSVAQVEPCPDIGSAPAAGGLASVEVGVPQRVRQASPPELGRIIRWQDR